MDVRRMVLLLLAAVVATQALPASAISLYQEGSYQPLASDRKARRPGDAITVLIYENSSATSTANTNTGRDASVGFDIDSFGKDRNAGIRSSNQLDGHGRTRREGRVLAQITVSVTDIAANGDLLVSGEQLLEVNNERQQIKVEGRVRQQDVSERNTVLSTRLVDARISYVGEGDLADRQHPSWWQKLLTWFGL